MATITMPQLGESVTEGTILRWMKHPGDRVELDDPLCEIETEKVTAELPSPYAGVMGAIVADEGETVPVGAVLCDLNEDVPSSPPSGGWTGGPMAIPPERPTHDSPVRSAAPAATVAPPTTPRADPGDRSSILSPIVARLARERGIDLATIQGSGAGGRVTRKDLDSQVATPPPAPEATVLATPPPAAGPFVTISLSPTRRRIAENLTHSSRDIPQAWTMVEVDVTGLVARRARERAQLEATTGGPVTLLPYFVEAVCRALQAHPALNGTFVDGTIQRSNAVNAGIAVAAESGLVVPVISHAGELSVAGLAARLRDLVDRARERKLRIEDVEGGTITINNTGAFGSIASKPLVNPPQVAIVTMERAARRLIVRDDDSLAIRTMMNVCLSFDHRALDGAEAGAFLAALRALIEQVI